MFGGRLHPYKPSARARLLLEKLGLAARSYRQAAEPDIFEALRQVDPPLLTLGISESAGGCGDDPVLLALAAERLGEEGLRVAVQYALVCAANSLIGRWGTSEARSRFLELVKGGKTLVAIPPAWTFTPGPQPAEERLCKDLLNTLGLGNTGTSGSKNRIWCVLNLETGPETLSWSVCPPGAAGDEAKEAAHLVRTALGETADELAVWDVVLQLMLLAAAGAVGFLTDAFRRSGLRGRDWTGQTRRRTAVARTLSEFGVRLEALRAFVLAAAELKAEWNEKPSLRFLPEVWPYFGELVLLVRQVTGEALGWLTRAVRSAEVAPGAAGMELALDEVWLVDYIGPDDASVIECVADFYL